MNADPPPGVVEYQDRVYVGRLERNGGLWIGKTNYNYNTFYIAMTDGTRHYTSGSFEVGIANDKLYTTIISTTMMVNKMMTMLTTMMTMTMMTMTTFDNDTDTADNSEHHQHSHIHATRWNYRRCLLFTVYHLHHTLMCENIYC